MIVILADDLTGASDAAAQFAQRGYDTRLCIDHGQIDSCAEVIALTADNRHVTSKNAYEAARTTLLPFTHSLSRLFIKIDSTMRGPILAHIAGALSVFDDSCPAHPAGGGQALICPAYPEMGRQVIDQVVLIDQVPVAQTAIGDDPVTTVSSSNMPEMLGCERFAGRTQHSSKIGEISVVPLTPNGDWTTTLGEALAAGVRVATADAATRQDLMDIADALTKFPEIVPVGSAGLAQECARIWTNANPVVSEPASHDLTPTVVLISSCHPASKIQLDSFLAHQPPRTVVLTSGNADSLGTRISDADVVIVVRPEERTEQATDLAGLLGRATAYLARNINAQSLILVGGDGARATLDSLGVTELRVNEPVAEGIGSMTALDGLPGVLVVTKAGGFGGPDALTTMVIHCQGFIPPDDKEKL